METKFKVGDKIKITKNSPSTYNLFPIGKEFFITNINDYDKKIIVLDDTYTIKPNDPRESHFYGDWELVQEKSRFHDAQPGDLLWNDERGICEVTKHFCNDPKFPTLGIQYSCGNGYECICLDGRSCISSPKATFFYYTPENHYLTERPEQEYEVDFAKVPQGTKVKVWNTEDEPQDFCTDYFMGYFPKLSRPFWTFNDSDKLEACGYKYCKLAEPCKPEWRK